LDGDTVRRDHRSSAICAALAVNENLSLGIGPNQIKELHDLSVGRIVSTAPGNPDLLHSERLDFALFSGSFLRLIPEVNDDSDTHVVEGAEARR
jgi:hypothetical protein